MLQLYTQQIAIVFCFVCWNILLKWYKTKSEMLAACHNLTIWDRGLYCAVATHILSDTERQWWNFHCRFNLRNYWAQILPKLCLPWDQNVLLLLRSMVLSNPTFQLKGIKTIKMFLETFFCYGWGEQSLCHQLPSGEDNKKKGQLSLPLSCIFLPCCLSPNRTAVSARWKQDNGKYEVSQFLVLLLTKEEGIFASNTIDLLIMFRSLLFQCGFFYVFRTANLEVVSLRFMQRKQPIPIVSVWWLIF